MGRFNVAHAIISAGGADHEGVSDFDPDEAELARLILKRGARSVVVTDADKFTRRGLVRVANWAGVDALVTDRAPPSAVGAALALAGVAVTLAT